MADKNSTDQDQGMGGMGGGMGGGMFAVEVSIPGSHPTKVSPFATEADAEVWIDNHRLQVQTQSQAGRWFQKARGR